MSILVTLGFQVLGKKWKMDFPFKEEIHNSTLTEAVILLN